jgi:hypothetical protein
MRVGPNLRATHILPRPARRRSARLLDPGMGVIVIDLIA